jgi:hypothetical protein
VSEPTAAQLNRLIGSVRFPGGLLAELLAGKTWRVTGNGQDFPDVARNLGFIYAHGWYDGPSDGYYGHRILTDLAASVGGKMTWIQPAPVPDGAVS